MLNRSFFIFSSSELKYPANFEDQTLNQGRVGSMASSAFALPIPTHSPSSSSFPALSIFNCHNRFPQRFHVHGGFPLPLSSSSQKRPSYSASLRAGPIFSFGGGGSAGSGGGSPGGSGGGGGGEGSGGEDEDVFRNRMDAILVLARVDTLRTLDSLPKDLAAAIQAGRVPGWVVERYLELEKNVVFRWLLQFGGFRERLLADDLFLTKVAIECGVGIFTKTAAELERRRERFTKELDFVFADVVMAIIADFMLVWLPAPTFSLRPPLAINAGAISTFFYGCPDNAFQVAMAGTSYSLLQRTGAVVRNGAKLFVVGTGASLIGTGVTNLLINIRKLLDKDFAIEAEDVPILSTSAAYGVYMAVSSNLRYQVLAGVIEQRILEPLLHERKLLLSAACFLVRTGNTFLGSLMWVDYARWVGVQKIRE